jgi:hypothetical protein
MTDPPSHIADCLTKRFVRGCGRKSISAKLDRWGVEISFLQEQRDLGLETSQYYRVQFRLQEYHNPRLFANCLYEFPWRQIVVRGDVVIEQVGSHEDATLAVFYLDLGRTKRHHFTIQFHRTTEELFLAEWAYMEATRLAYTMLIVGFQLLQEPRIGIAPAERLFPVQPSDTNDSS